MHLSRNPKRKRKIATVRGFGDRDHTAILRNSKAPLEQFVAIAEGFEPFTFVQSTTAWGEAN
jgi:hypothetical protein